MAASRNVQFHPQPELGSKANSNFQKGLTSSEAKERLEKYGPNVLPERPPPSDFVIFISQFKNPLVYVLLAAGLITLFIGHFSDTIIIFFAVLINTILGFIQERRANRALHALKKLIHPTAEVIRDGEIKNIDVSAVVPGDIAILNQGYKVPADGKLIKANRLYLSEAILTGESVPVEKKDKDSVFMGTIVVAGRGEMVAETTGPATAIGKIAESVQEPSEDTPLRRQLAFFSKQLSILVGALTLFVLIIGLLSDRDLLSIFTTSVALAVSAIPEGLLVALTVVLAIGMQRILAKKGLVRNLVSAETLGGVTTICVDKTGTLTEGKVKVVDVVGDKEKVALQVLIANDLDDPLLVAAYDWAKEKINHLSPNIDRLVRKYLRLDSYPFSPNKRYFASLNKWDPSVRLRIGPSQSSAKGGQAGQAKNIIFVNGAPEILIEMSVTSSAQRRKIEGEIERLTKQGKRVIGLVRKIVPISKIQLETSDIKDKFEWLGLLAFSDPVRPGVAEVLSNTKNAGLDVAVITGDYAQTAISVMRQLNIKVDEESTLQGPELDRMTVGVLAKRLAKESRVKLFARTTPAQKLKIVEALKANGEVVAMMGDGVNDAPALKRADIGIVVGEASDVAKESADLVLIDSRFETIVSAIEEGRGIFDNIRKIILYLMSDAFEEIIAVGGALIMRLPLPVSAAQILWINLVSDGFPHLALTVDPKQEGIMEKPPRSPSEPLVIGWMKKLILIVSGAGGLMALLLFIYFYKVTDNLNLSQSIAFATLGVNSLVYVFSVKTLTEPFWRENPFKNKWLNLAVFAGLLLQLAPFTVPALRTFFKLVALSPLHWLVVFTVSFVMFIIIEVSKFIFRERFFAKS